MPSTEALVALVTGDWVPDEATLNQQPAPKIPVHLNEQAIVLAETEDWSYLVIKRHKSCKRGWVPRAVVQNGQPPADPLPIEIPEVKPPSGPMPLPQKPAENVLHDTIRRLWREIKVDPERAVRQADRSSVSITKVLYGPGIDQYADIFYRCLVPEAVQIMQTGQFDPMDFVDQMTAIEKDSYDLDEFCGIYMYFFWDINDDMTGLSIPLNGLYIGQSLEFAERRKAHEVHMRNPRPEGDARVHKLGRTALASKMVPLILFKNDDPEIVHFGKHVLLAAAELTAVCLFTSWYPSLYRSEPQPGSGGQITIAYEYAKIYCDLVNSISTQTQWNPAPTIGLNWLTPGVCQISRERQWLSYYSWHRAMSVYRFRRAIFINGDIGQGIRWRSKDCKITIPKHIQDVSKFTNGDIVTLCAEIAHDGDNYTDHPIPWARVPRPCHNPEFEKLRSLALSIEWTDESTGQWKSAPLQWTQVRTRIKSGDSEFEYAQLIQGIRLFSALNQTVYTDAPKWVLPSDRTTIRHLGLDYLEQRAVLSPTPTNGVVKSWPENRIMEENETFIRNSIPDFLRAHVFIGARPRSGFKRSRCDLCTSLADSTPGICDHDPESGTCAFCVSFQRPCTWTKYGNGVDRMNLIMPSGRLGFLGMPPNVQSMIKKGTGRGTSQSLIFDMKAEPSTVWVEKKLQGESVLDAHEDNKDYEEDL